MPAPSSRCFSLLSLLLCLVALVALVALAACTRPNPDFCCSSESECASFGVSEVRTCGSSQVCASNVCIEAQCATNGDCIGAAEGEICAADNVCVGCLSNDDCGEEAPICDPVKRACAPCRSDADCASGVCLAADGVCAKEGEMLYVSKTGSDNGLYSCTKAAPCRTITAALSYVTSLRHVVRLVGSDYEAPGEITLNSKNVYIDGENTQLRRVGAGPFIVVSGTSRVTIEGIKYSVPAPANGIEISSSETTRLSQLNASGAASASQNAVFVSAGTTKVTESEFVNAWILSAAGTIYLEGSSLTGGALDGGTDSSAYVNRNVFRDARVTMSGGMIFRNNLFISLSPTCRPEFGGGRPSEYHFNTFVCRHNPPVSDPFEGAVLGCGPGDRPTGNLFAWDSINPAPGCMARNSIFPSFASPVAGENNAYVDMGTVFVDYLGGDYHLSTNSPAKGAGDPKSTLKVDLEGNPRPNPAGSAPDIGAFEAP